jgi:hypothetical protein
MLKLAKNAVLFLAAVFYHLFSCVSGDLKLCPNALQQLALIYPRVTRMQLSGLGIVGEL